MNLRIAFSVLAGLSAMAFLLFAGFQNVAPILTISAMTVVGLVVSCINRFWKKAATPANSLEGIAAYIEYTIADHIRLFFSAFFSVCLWYGVGWAFGWLF